MPRMRLPVAALFLNNQRKGTMRISGKMSAAVAAFVLATLAEPSPTYALEFSASTAYPVGTAPVAIVIADFNGDGKPDLAVANSGSSNVSILLNNGDGTFQAAVNHTAGTSPTMLVAGDFDGDGKQDLIVVNLGDVSNHVNGNLSFLKGKGDGTFQAAVNISVGVNPNTIVAADFSGDNKLDLAVGDASATTVNILIGNGDGTFKAPLAISTGGTTVSLATADFDGDSKADLAISVKGATGVVLLGKGDGTFQTGQPAAIGSGLLAVGDFNGDHKPDLITRIHTVPVPPCRIFCVGSDTTNVYLGNGDGTFQTGLRAATFFSSGAGNVAVADFNGDGKLDFSLGRLTSAILYLGKNDGTFLNMQSLVVVNDSHFMSAADLNDDKKPDLVTTNQSNDTISVLLNQSPASGADLGITKRADQEPALATQNLTYTMNVSNTGPQDATNVTVTDPLPASMTFVSATPSQGTCSGTTTVTCNLGAMPSPSQATLTVVVTPTQAGSFTNTATIAATEPDLATANNSASVTTTVLLPADLVLTKAASPSSLDVGGNITYTLVVTNKGPASASNVLLTDTPNNNFPIVSITPTQGSCTSDPNTGTITCNLGSLAVSASATVHIVVTANVPANSSNNAGVTADQPNLGNNSASVTVLIGAADLAITQSASPTTVTAGSNVTFAMTITNKGPFSARNVQIIDSLPQNNVVSATPSQGSCGAVANFQLGCALGSLASGSSATVTVVMAPAAAGQFTNMVSVSSDSPDTDGTNNTSSATVTVNPAPDFSFSAASMALVAHPGGSVTDTLTFSALNGLIGTIALSCVVSGPPPTPTCDLSPNSIAASANPATSTLTVHVPVSANLWFVPLGHWRVRPIFVMPLWCAILSLLLAMKQLTSKRRILALSGACAAAALVLCGCGSGSSTPPPKSYTITVTATTNSSSGQISHTTSVGLTVE